MVFCTTISKSAEERTRVVNLVYSLNQISQFCLFDVKKIINMFWIAILTLTSPININVPTKVSALAPVTNMNTKIKVCKDRVLPYTERNTYFQTPYLAYKVFLMRLNSMKLHINLSTAPKVRKLIVPSFEPCLGTKINCATVTLI